MRWKRAAVRGGRKRWLETDKRHLVDESNEVKKMYNNEHDKLS